MGLFNKLFDLATNLSGSYEEENEVYQEVVEEIESINKILTYYTEDEGLRDYPDLYKKIRLKIIEMNNKIYIHKRNLTNTKNKAEYDRKLKEINDLVNDLNELIINMKNYLLTVKTLGELMDHLTNLQVIINSNARFAALREFIDYDYYTIEDLNDLRNEISDRRCVIIPYLGDIYKR